MGEQIEKMPTFREKGGGPSVPGGKVIKKAAKTGIKAGKTVIKVGLGGIFTLGTIIIEFVPFIGDISPTWTLRVIYELIQGEL